MDNTTEAKILRIYISTTDKFRYRPLYEVIVFAARRYGMAGATVLKGFMGYGASSVIRSRKFYELVEKMPLVIEIVDESEKIDAFVQVILPYFDKVTKGGLITVENAGIILHKSGKEKNRIYGRNFSKNQ